MFFVCKYMVAQKKTEPLTILSRCKYSENSMTELHENWVDFCNII